MRTIKKADRSFRPESRRDEVEKSNQNRPVPSEVEGFLDSACGSARNDGPSSILWRDTIFTCQKENK